MLSNIICYFYKKKTIIHVVVREIVMYQLFFVRWEESRLEKVVSTNNRMASNKFGTQH